jgi:hypothetical protein
MNFNTLGGRRFLFAVGLSVGSAVLLWFGKLTSPDFASILNFNVIALVAGHSADKFAGRKSNDTSTD